MIIAYHTYILINGSFGINFTVHSTYGPQDDVDLIAKDGLRLVPWVFLAHIICNNSGDNSVLKLSPSERSDFLKGFMPLEGMTAIDLSLVTMFWLIMVILIKIEPTKLVAHTPLFKGELSALSCF